LKGRWRCLRKERALHYTPAFAGNIISLYLFLMTIYFKYFISTFYNILILARIINAIYVILLSSIMLQKMKYREENIEAEEIKRENANMHDARGNAVRQTLIQQYLHKNIFIVRT